MASFRNSATGARGGRSGRKFMGDEYIKRRSALERINNRIERSFDSERYFIRGQAKIKTRVGLALVVTMAMVLGPIR